MTLTRLKDGYTPPEPYLLLRLLGAAPPSGVSVGGVAAQAVASEANLASSAGDAFCYNASLQAVVVKLMDTRPLVSVEVRLPS